MTNFADNLHLLVDSKLSIIKQKQLMKNRLLWTLMLAMVCTLGMAKKKVVKQELWPNGEPMDAWFADTAKVDVAKLGKQYVLTDYGVRQGTCDIQTQQIQAVIDRAANEGGGVIVVPKGTLQAGYTSLY